LPRAASLAAAATTFLVAVAPCFAQRNLSVALPPPSEQRVALIIGNAAYPEAPLRNPANDASDVAAALRELGFDVFLARDSGQREMKQAIRGFGERLASGGVGVFYYAGHGLQFKGRNYLVPIGARIDREADIEDEAVDVNFVLAQMEEARNRLNIVILDACRNNPYARSSRSVARGLAQMDATSGTLIAFATAPGSIAADGSGRNGVYTKHLLQQIAQPGLPVELMLKRVRNAVMEETKDRQVPWESSSLRGADFYFRPAAAQPAAGNVAAPAESAVHNVEVQGLAAHDPRRVQAAANQVLAEWAAANALGNAPPVKEFDGNWKGKTSPVDAFGCWPGDFDIAIRGGRITGTATWPADRARGVSLVSDVSGVVVNHKIAYLRITERGGTAAQFAFTATFLDARRLEAYRPGDCAYTLNLTRLKETWIVPPASP
jgi:uncharacterized caspase-like protein